MSRQRFLVGTDFSAQAEAALAHAMALAHREGAELVLAHATSYGELARLAAGDGALASRMSRLLDSARVASNAQLEALAERCRSAGIPTSIRIANDLPDRALPQLADELGAALVVVGTHGHTGVRRMLLGSVAERVVRLTETDVLVARAPGDVSDGYTHILVPTDFSDLANRALERAIALAAPGGRVELFHSWALPATASAGLHGAQEILGSLRDELAARAKRDMQAVMDRYRDAKVMLIFEQSEDPPVQGVRRRLDEVAFELVVIGSHGRRGLPRWILGSVAEATVRHAPCSVLVVHPRSHP